MSPEFRQPEIARPDLKNPATWSAIVIPHTEWIRSAAPQLGLDPSKILLATALEDIEGDDVNAFGLTCDYSPAIADHAKSSLFTRMTWEEELPELPQVIREQIKKVHRRLEVLDWKDEEGFQQARSIWIKEVRNFTKRQIALNASLREAQAYYREVNTILSPYWSDYLYGSDFRFE